MEERVAFGVVVYTVLLIAVLWYFAIVDLLDELKKKRKRPGYWLDNMDQSDFPNGLDDLHRDNFPPGLN